MSNKTSSNKTSSNKALIVVDVQNDYFPGGKFTLHNAENALDRVEAAIAKARAAGAPVVLVRHVIPTDKGPGPFFNEAESGSHIHARVLAAAPDAPTIVKVHADCFQETALENILAGWEIGELLLCGMMTHHCITYTAFSKSAEKYKTTVLSDACASVGEIVHLLALKGLGTRVETTKVDQAF